MRVVGEGEKSRAVAVGSGVPQGTALGPLLFLCHINDLPECVESQIRLFADNCLLYSPIKTPKDHQILQQDLNNLQKWASDWGMKFNAKKCYLLSTKNRPSHCCCCCCCFLEFPRFLLRAHVVDVSWPVLRAQLMFVTIFIRLQLVTLYLQCYLHSDCLYFGPIQCP